MSCLKVDHLVYGCPGALDDAMDAFEARTGVAPALGGRHAGLGTHNALVALGGGAYFEILCRDPSQPDPSKACLASPRRHTLTASLL